MPWKVKKFKDVYVSTKGRPILLRHEHLEMLDEIRNSFNQRRLYPGQEPISTTEVVAACLDAIFSHPGIPFHAAGDKQSLAQLIVDHIHESVVDHWRRHQEAP